eukprot:7723489-Pyramimonas_sp.AAC.1
MGPKSRATHLATRQAAWIDGVRNPSIVRPLLEDLSLCLWGKWEMGIATTSILELACRQDQTA